MSNSDYPRVSAAALERFTREVFTAAGMPPEDAATEAEVLLWANLRGVDSHGVQRIAEYLKAVDAGQMNVRPAIRVERERAGTVLIEADNAFGPVVTVLALDKVIAKARETGVAWAEIRNTTHQGAMAYYVERAASQGVAAIAVVCSPPNMAPPGARAAGVHNSPIAIGVPGGEHGPLVLDMATSVAAGGKLSVAKDRRQAIPESWALDSDGRPTTDPFKAAFLRPTGDHKGYGLALMFECLTSLMVANPLLCAAIEDPSGERKRTQNSFLAAIDIESFGPAEQYHANVERTVAALHSLPTTEDAAPVMVPGEPERRTLAERSANGIPLPPGTADKLRDAAARFDLALPEGL